MSELAYLNLDLLVERAEPDYRVRVLTSPAGETKPVSFRVPFSDLQLENFLLKIGQPRRNVRKIGAPQVTAIKDFGGRLFDAVFSEELHVKLALSQSRADDSDAGLRIRLRFSDCPELSELPWEYLYDGEHNRFLCLDDRTPLVRYLEVADPVRVLPVTPPLRILVVIAAPSDLQQLDGEKEWSNVTAALSELQQRGRVEVVRLAKPTLGALQRQLRRGTYHIFHFIGHGGFEPNTQGGMLAMEDDHGRARLVGGEYLGRLLHNHRSLRLAVLNSCEGARGDSSDPFSGTAQSLVQQGIPAVVAMQFEITDDAAITFGHVLYEAIADGYPLDAATTEARIAVYADGNLTEWGTPVLYLRAPDGHIFDIQPPSSEEQARQEAAAQARREAAAQAQQEADERARQEAAAQAQQEADERARQEAAAQAQQEADERARQEAAAQAQQEADERARQEAAAQAQQEADERARQEAAAQAQQEADERARQEAEELRRQEPRPSHPPPERRSSPTAPAPTSSTPPSKSGGRRRVALILTAAAVVVGILVGAAVYLRPTPNGPTSAEAPSSSTEASASNASSPTPTKTTEPPKWEKLKTGFQEVGLAGVAAHNGELWVVGGQDAKGKRDAVLVFNPQTKKWRPGPKLPKPITHAPLVSTGDKLYLLGGLTETKADRESLWPRSIASIPKFQAPGSRKRAASTALWGRRRLGWQTTCLRRRRRDLRVEHTETSGAGYLGAAKRKVGKHR